MGRFDGKVILISGGASGMGAADTRALVAEGAKVVIGDVQDARGKALANELGRAVTFVRLDVTNEADWARAVEAASALGGLHGLVNSAGVYELSGLMGTEYAVWDRVVRTNQYGTYLGMRAAVPAIERSGGGSIVNMSSAAGMRGSSAFAYGAAKWAVRGMTKSAAIELASKKIRVNSIHPGPIATDMMAARTAEETEAWMKRVPMHRQGTADEAAALVLFLLSDQSSYVTGAEITIDGGLTA